MFELFSSLILFFVLPNITFFVLVDDYEGFMNSSFNPDHPIKILFHGFSDNGDTLWTNVREGVQKFFFSADVLNLLLLISMEWF